MELGRDPTGPEDPRPRTRPPALPAKQRRSMYSEGSSADLDYENGGLPSPAGLQEHNQLYEDVFREAVVQCHAAWCPIHQGSSCCPQDDVFSACPPPPVPRKKLVRTMSLPEPCNPPAHPRRPPRPPLTRPQCHGTLQCFDNPLYMLAPLEGVLSQEHRAEPTAAAQRSAVSDSTPLSQLSFDAPDETLLPYLLSDAAHASIVHSHVLFLRSAARTLEDNLLLPVKAGGRPGADSFTPEDFQLCDGDEPVQIGEDVYFKLRCNRFPNKVLGARIYTPDHLYAAHCISKTPHVNLQDVLAHFSPSSTQEAAQVQTGTHASQPDCTPSGRPLGGGSESVDCQPDSPRNNPATVIALLERGHAVRVERDFPHATLEDFIQCRCAEQTSDTALYAKQLCVLLLQVVSGLQQMYRDAGMYVELRPSNILLVWPSGAPTASDRAEVKKATEQDARENTAQEAVHVHWGNLGAPRVVLPNTPYRSLSKQDTVSSTVNAQIGALIQRGLNPGDRRSSFLGSTGDLYTERLLDLAGLLQDESAALPLSDTKTILQALLWGPRAQIFTFNIGADTSTVDSWLAIRRSLLVLKMAERGLLQDGALLDWEASLHLHYLAFCDGVALSRASEHLGQLTKL